MRPPRNMLQAPLKTVGSFTVWEANHGDKRITVKSAKAGDLVKSSVIIDGRLVHSEAGYTIKENLFSMGFYYALGSKKAKIGLSIHACKIFLEMARVAEKTIDHLDYTSLKAYSDLLQSYKAENKISDKDLAGLIGIPKSFLSEFFASLWLPPGKSLDKIKNFLTKKGLLPED